MDYVHIGRKIAEYSTRRGKSITVTYSQKAIDAIRNSGKALGKELNDVFEYTQSPEVTISAKEGRKYVLGTMTTKDIEGILEEKFFVLPQKTNILDFLPAKVSNAKTKVVFDKNDIDEILSKDFGLEEYFAPIVYNAKKPTMEILSKRNDKFNTTMFILKDEGKVISQGAYSLSKDKEGHNVHKFRFSTSSEMVNGYRTRTKKTTMKRPYMPKNKKEEASVLADVLLKERPRWLFKNYYGIGTRQKLMSEIADYLFLTESRCRQILNNAILKLDVNHRIFKELDFNDLKKPFKYLTEEEQKDYLYHRSQLLYGGRYEEDAITAIKGLKDLSELRRKKYVKNLINE